MTLRVNSFAAMQDLWTSVDRYVVDLFVAHDDALAASLQASEAAGLPPHHVAPNQGKLLHLLARTHGARRILEIGTLGGYSTIWLARALPADGHLLTLESNLAHADVARANMERAGVEQVVELRTGRAIDTLRDLVASGEPPFDFFFIDADKPSNPQYLALALKLARRGSVIIADNVIRGGAVIDSASEDPNVRGIREFNQQLAADPRIATTVIQTVGEKGYDGFAFALVLDV